MSISWSWSYRSRWTQKPEDFAALDTETDVVNGYEITEASRQPGFDGCHTVFGAAWWDDELAVPAALALGNSAMNACSSVLVPVRVLRSCGLPVANTLRASMAISQSKPSAIHVGGGHQHASVGRRRRICAMSSQN